MDALLHHIAHKPLAVCKPPSGHKLCLHFLRSDRQKMGPSLPCLDHFSARRRPLPACWRRLRDALPQWLVQYGPVWSCRFCSSRHARHVTSHCARTGARICHAEGTAGDPGVVGHFPQAIMVGSCQEKLEQVEYGLDRLRLPFEFQERRSALFGRFGWLGHRHKALSLGTLSRRTPATSKRCSDSISSASDALNALTLRLGGVRELGTSRADVVWLCRGPL